MPYKPPPIHLSHHRMHQRIAKNQTTPITAPMIDNMTMLTVLTPVHQIMNAVQSTAKAMDAGTNQV